MYGSFLRAVNQPEKACEVVEKYAEELDESDDMYHYNCYDICLIFTDADQHMDKALELALKIPKDDPRGLQILRHFIKRCTALKNEDIQGVRTELSELHIKAVQNAMERAPDDALLDMEMAVALCLAGNNLDGARWYRKALGSGRIDEHNQEYGTIGLIKAQLQCPGMLLEDRHVVSTLPSGFICVRNEFRQYLFDAGGGQIGVQGAEGVSVQVEQHEIPNGPDDPEYFSASFLETVHPDQIEGNNRVEE